MYIYEALARIKSLDAQAAENAIEDAKLSIDDFADYVTEYLRAVGLTLDDIDIVSMSYSFIADTANVPDLRKYIYKNYIDTRFDVSSEDAKKILRKVHKSERNEAWQWIYDRTV